jgi:hypothetical protein
MFLRLKELCQEQPDLFEIALILFAERYGLLGAFEEDYQQHPVFPIGQMLVAPEAVIDGEGRLRFVDPSTEGRKLLIDLLEPKGWRLSGERDLKAKHSVISLPSAIQFIAKQPDLDSFLWPSREAPRQLALWEEIRKDFGALLVLDEEAFKGVSVLCTREPLRRWTVSLQLFPSGDTPAEQLANDRSLSSFNSYLEQAAPRAVLGKDGNLERGWSCRSLLQAMYVMLWLDLTGGSTIKKCKRRKCSNYFRIGSQSKSIYCSRKCADTASTRKGRGQEP